ncbi:aminodeoxychorismate/anthranilate synthase component II [Candidatus Micrarchaeota archaeon]|nr:aminodeoxychorismate/anthranilate synthase component II [Candidatus Micrarchaeota archaeon]
MIVIIDNYDSFVYNLAQYFGDLGVEVKVFRNDKITIDELKKLGPEKIVLSPGPGNPTNKKDFGVCSEILEQMQNVPILGVCLGHQGIIARFGGKVVKNRPMHGKTSQIKHDGLGIFSSIKNPMIVMRYHSLVGTEIPKCLEITARSMDDNCVMAVQHKSLPIYGVQFHPESIMTENGKQILKNFLRVKNELA